MRSKEPWSQISKGTIELLKTTPCKGDLDGAAELYE